MASIEEVSDRTLRAWAGCGVISSASYVEEMERRRAPTRETRTITTLDGQTVELFGPDRMPIEAPPLDYELDRDLDVPDLDRIEAMFDDGVPLGPMPKAVAWIMAVAVISVIAITLWLVWP